MAPAILPFATRTMASAACMGSSPSGSADMLCDSGLRRLDIQARKLAADGTLCIDAPQHNIGVGERRTSIALPVATGPGREPALSGPTWSSLPASTWAIDPPPAPIVVISIIGVRMTRPKSMVVCAASAVSPSTTSDTSKEVPPRSPVMTSGKPAAFAMAAAAITPAAGPDRAVRTGRRRAVAVDMTPPFD